jgi:CRP/FNR family transcriptional regulator
MGDLDALLGKFGKTFSAGEHIFYEGDEGDELYLVHSGEVKIYMNVGDKELTLGHLHDDDFFGEVAALLGEYRTAGAVAVRDTTVIAFPAGIIEKVIMNQAEVAVRLLKLMARRLKAADDLIAILVQNNPQARVVLGLIRVAQATGRETDEGIHVALDEMELASQVEVSESDAAGVIDQLDKKGIVTRADGGLLIRSMDDLDEFYQFLELQARFGG